MSNTFELQDVIEVWFSDGTVLSGTLYKRYDSIIYLKNLELRETYRVDLRNQAIAYVKKSW